MRALGLILLTVMLTACVTRDPSVTLTAPTQSSGAWRIEQAVDRVTGDAIPKAWVTTSRTNYTRTGTAWPATVALTCFDRKPIVRIAFGYKIGSNKNSKVAYRFDDKTGGNADATILPDYKTIIIDDKKTVTTFMDELAGASMLLVRVDSLFAGRATALFPVAGAPPAIDAITAGCGADAPKRTAARM